MLFKFINNIKIIIDKIKLIKNILIIILILLIMNFINIDKIIIIIISFKIHIDNQLLIEINI